MKKILLPILALAIVASFSVSCNIFRKQSNSSEVVYQGKSFDDYIRSGDRKLTARNYQGALEDFDKAVEMDSYSPDAYNYRGIVRYYMDDFAGALIDFNKAIELQPDYAEAYNLRGIVKGELKDEKGACEDWERAFELGFSHAFMLLKKFCTEE
ncbi:MAG: tetratricopeptide repeat protein [Bacteroidales bacterium]|nr:tetratricopeptide repeat protein [Bacteroidales bacterium]